MHHRHRHNHHPWQALCRHWHRHGRSSGYKNHKHCTHIGIGITTKAVTGKYCANIGLAKGKGIGKRIGVGIGRGIGIATNTSAGKHFSPNMDGLHVRLAGSTCALGGLGVAWAQPLVAVVLFSHFPFLAFFSTCLHWNGVTILTTQSVNMLSTRHISNTIV